MNGIRGTAPLPFDRSQAIARAQAAFQAFKPPGGPQAPAAQARMLADTAQRTGLSPAAVQRLWASYAQAAAQGIPPEAMARVQSAAQAYLTENGRRPQAPPPEEAGFFALLGAKLAQATPPALAAAFPAAWPVAGLALAASAPAAGVARLQASLGPLLGQTEAAFAQGVTGLVGQASSEVAEGQLSEDVKAFQDGAKALQGEASQVLKGLRAASQGLGAQEDGRLLQALDATEARVKATGDRVKAVGGLGLAGSEALEGAVQGWEAAQALAQGDLSATSDLVKSTEAVADFAQQSSEALQGLRARRDLPEGTRFARGLDRFARGAIAVQRISQAVMSGEKLWGQGGSLAKALGGLGQGDLAQGLVDAGNAGLDTVKGVGDAAKAVKGGAVSLGAAEGRVARAAQALSLEGDLAKARLGVAGGTLGALGGLLQLRQAVGSFSEGQMMKGTSEALGGGAAALTGVGQVAKVVAPAGRLATTLGGRAVPLLGVVSGLAQSAGALAKEPPDVKAAATGAASAVGSALLPFAPVGTAVGGVLIVGAAVVDNWDAIASVADAAGGALGEGLDAVGLGLSQDFQSRLSSVASWFG